MQLFHAVNVVENIVAALEFVHTESRRSLVYLVDERGGDRAVSERVAFIHSAANGYCADSMAAAFEITFSKILEVTKDIANGIRLIVTVVRTIGKGVCRECAHSYGSRKQGREHPFYQRVFLLCLFHVFFSLSVC